MGSTFESVARRRATLWIRKSLAMQILMIGAATSSIQCPSTPVIPPLPHASCSMEVSFEGASCDEIRGVIESRVANQPSHWHDPHDRTGYYTIESNSTTQIALHRHGNSPIPNVTDKQLFSFRDDGHKKCVVSACSASQIISTLDDNNNYCSLHNLYCTESKCHPLSPNEYRYKEDIDDEHCVQHITDDCYKV
jgi:hypothetical protein